MRKHNQPLSYMAPGLQPKDIVTFIDHYFRSKNDGRLLRFCKRKKCFAILPKPSILNQICEFVEKGEIPKHRFQDAIDFIEFWKQYSKLPE